MKNWHLGASLRALFIGRARDLSDHRLFHKISLIAVLAWVGLGADGLSSSCYGPEETFKALGAHSALSVFVAFACVATIAIICASYRQIIELFPAGGGGYLVASKLLSPAAGVVSGAALLVDYVLTIAISVASGADALFSVVPAAWHPWKLAFACVGVALLTLLNLRGVRESVMLWVPVFFLFVGTHALAILIAVISHANVLPTIVSQTAGQVSQTHAELGMLGMLGLMLKAYSMGAGTYTGIEAVSNGLPILREPRVETGKRTMNYMGASLAITVFGLLLAYLLYAVQPVEGKTLNAVLFEKITAAWPGDTGKWFVAVSMLSATALLFIAAQAGFLDGPRVLANMALDRWFPSRFATLSDRFVAQKGILLMGGAALFVVLVTRGAVGLLVVLYSINVFITFSLSQFGMVRHWWQSRATASKWRRKLVINGIGLLLTSFILISICVVKFAEGGWITLAVTGALVAVAFAIKRHYTRVAQQLEQLDEIVNTPDVPVTGENKLSLAASSDPPAERGRSTVAATSSVSRQPGNGGVGAVIGSSGPRPSRPQRVQRVEAPVETPNASPLTNALRPEWARSGQVMERGRSPSAAPPNAGETDESTSPSAVGPAAGRDVPRSDATAANRTRSDPKAKTAVFLVNGFNGLGLHTVLHAMRLFDGAFRYFVFAQVGVVDAGNFKGSSEIDRLRAHVQMECERYVEYLRRSGHRAEAFTSLGPDAVEEISKLAPEIAARLPNAVFFAGQLVFEHETVLSRGLHNYTVFALQRRFYLLGLPFVTLPIRLARRLPPGPVARPRSV